MKAESMRKQKKIVLWPAYFDGTKTRKEGRRIPKKTAVSNPKLEELEKAIKKINLTPQTEVSAAYPKNPWKKTGVIYIDKAGKKTAILREIAKHIVKRKLTKKRKKRKR